MKPGGQCMNECRCWMRGKGLPFCLAIVYQEIQDQQTPRMISKEVQDQTALAFMDLVYSYGLLVHFFKNTNRLLLEIPIDLFQNMESYG